MKKIIKVATSTISIIILLILVLSVIGYFVAKSPIPEYEGERTVTGITAPVKVYRDSFAVAFIEAQSGEDAAFAIGYAHAQERLFQMDLTRRAGEGKLSEVFGTRTIPFDKMFKTVGLYKLVKENIDKYNPESLKLVEAYADGVNQYMKDAEGNYSIEFDILGYTPEPWKKEHSLLIAKLLAWELNISWWTDMSFTHIIQKVGRDKVKELLPEYPENGAVIIPPELEDYADVRLDMINTDRRFREFMNFTGTHIGSNNWAVNGSKSESGSAVVANDPHLAFQAPGKWYTVVINSPEWNVTGFTIPGVPGVVIGKNENIAWTMTNVMADDADFYIEKLDSTGTKYMLNGSWNELDIYSDTVTVKDSADVVFDVKRNHRGPIVSGIHPYRVFHPNEYQDSAVVSMRWTALDFSDELYAMVGVNKAKDWNEFVSSLEYFKAPGQNFVYGDKQGNIGYVCAAKLPVRENVSPTLVYDGTTDLYDWKGYVPYNEMPRMFNPGSEYIATANNKVDRSFPHHISNIWEPTSRIHRINELLESKQAHSIGDHKKYQNDFYSHYAESILPSVLKAFESVKINDDNLDTALNLLREWDFVMDRDSQAPTVFLTFYQSLLENIFMDELGEALFKEYVIVANVPYRSVQDMLLSDNSSEWFDDVDTDEYETRNTVIRNSMNDALTYLEETLGTDPADWQWGRLHTVTFKHFFSGQAYMLDAIINIGPYELGGDGTTINNTEYSFREPYANKLGPSMRFLFDFANPDEFVFIMPTGQSGHILSDHYDDMTQLWLDGKYIHLNTDIDSLNKAKLKLFTMKPAN